MDEHGNVVVDKFQVTSKPNVYAIGDVCGKYLLTPGKSAWIKFFF